MKEMMIDLETLDVKSSSVVLSIGAVVFECAPTMMYAPGEDKPHEALNYRVLDRFYRILDIADQLQSGRTVSQRTLLWWMQQDQDARDEAFSSVRTHPYQVMDELQVFTDEHSIIKREYQRVGEVEQYKEEAVQINKFWASPVGFDFGIWNSLADDFGHSTPWSYRQVYDVRTVLNEASYSAKGHILSRNIPGKAHMPVRDCEVQIDELVAARNKIGRRMS